MKTLSFITILIMTIIFCVALIGCGIVMMVDKASLVASILFITMGALCFVSLFDLIKEYRRGEVI